MVTLTFLITLSGLAKSLAQEGGTITPGKVLFLTTNRNDTVTHKLSNLLKAHLSGISMNLEIIDLVRLPNDKTKAASIAKELIIKENASAAIWLSEEKDTAFVLALEFDQAPWLVEAKEDPTSPAWHESISVTITSDLAALLPASFLVRSSVIAHPVSDGGQTSRDPVESTIINQQPQDDIEKPEEQPKEQPKPDPPPEQQPPLTETSDPPNRSSAIAHPVIDGRQASPTQKKQTPFWLGLTSGYAAQWTAEDITALHGARLGLTSGFAKYFGANLLLDIGQPAVFDVYDEPSELSRWTLRLTMKAHLSWKWIEFGIGIGPLITNINLGGLEEEPLDERSSENQPILGLAFSAIGHLWVTNWMGFRIEFGGDLLQDTLLYTFDDETSIATRRFTPTFTAGLSFKWNLTGNKSR